MWRFFEPPVGGGNDDYAFLANRLFGGVQMAAPAYDLTAALQYVHFGGLPRDAVGPGPLGTGAVYYAHAGRSDSHQIYLRYANVRLKHLVPATSIQIGRMPYSSGGEAASGNSKIEAVKLQRVAARLIGEFEWSIYQRAHDGVRIDTTRPRWTGTAFAFHPTQGGFEDAAGLMMSAVTVIGGAATITSATSSPTVQYQAFAYRYRDTRKVTQRPDNTGRSAQAIDVGINTFGGSIIVAPPITHGHQWDGLVWMAAQTGSWYELHHRAASVAIEAGHRWTRAPYRPWLRAGYLWASGDRNAEDDRHGTFFQMLPSSRKYALSSVYSQMNLSDAFAQLAIEPRGLRARIEVHALHLASGADLWYQGSGATASHGRFFGFSGRSARGDTALGTVVEGAVDVPIKKYWSINAYGGVMSAGDVVTNWFTDKRLLFWSVENVLRF